MKRILTLLMAVCLQAALTTIASAQTEEADAYFTIWFKDGTTRNYYSGDVSHMGYSNIDLEGNYCEDVVVQEIIAAGELERYLLSDIEEISFERLNLPFDINEYFENWDTIHAVVDDYFKDIDLNEPYDFSQLNEKIPEIKALPKVAEVEIFEDYMSITLENGSMQLWHDFRDEGVTETAYVPKRSSEKDVQYDEESKHYINSGLKKVLFCNTIEGTFSPDFTSVFDSNRYNVEKISKWDNDKISKCDVFIYHGHGYFMPDSKTVDNVKYKYYCHIVNSGHISQDFLIKDKIPEHNGEERYWMLVTTQVGVSPY